MISENIENIDRNPYITQLEKDDEGDLSESTNHSVEDIDILVPLEQLSYEVLEKKDQIDVKVRIVYVNNDVYEGEIDLQGVKEGWGVYLYSNHERYEGFWQNNRIHGYGKYFFKGGEYYEGDWYEGRKEGVGILKFNQGDRYEGEFYRDDFDGKGTFFYANGEKFDGEWREGKKNGQGTFWGKERKIVGEWLEDELQHF